jgi:hypothetical protein
LHCSCIPTRSSFIFLDGSAASQESSAEGKTPVCQRDALRRLRELVSPELVSVMVRDKVDTYHARFLAARCARRVRRPKRK